MKLKPLILENPFDEVKIPERWTWTYSSVRQFRKCKRKFFWKYIMRLRPRFRDAALAIGSAFHDAVAEWYGSKRSSMAKIAERYVEKLEAEFAENNEAYDQKEYDKFEGGIQALMGMLCGYADVYSEDRKKWPIDKDLIEAEFCIDMDDFDFAGKIDLVVPGKKPFIVEHKTAAKIGDSYVDRLPMDTQVRAYIFGAQYGLDIKVRKVLYDVIRKPSIRRKSNETQADYNKRLADDYMARPGFYFFREPLIFNMADVNSFEYELMQTHTEFNDILERCRKKEKEEGGHCIAHGDNTTGPRTHGL